MSRRAPFALEPALTGFLELTAHRLQATLGGIVRLDGPQPTLIAASGIGHRPGALLPPEVLPVDGLPRWVADASLVPALQDAPWVQGEPGVRFCAACPVPGHPEWVLFVADAQPRAAVAEEDLEALRVCALIAAPLLHHLHPGLDVPVALGAFAEHLGRDVAVAQAALNIYALSDRDLEPLALMQEVVRVIGVEGNLDACGVLALDKHQARLVGSWPHPGHPGTATPPLFPARLDRAEHAWLWNAAQQTGVLTHPPEAVLGWPLLSSGHGALTVPLGEQGGVQYLLLGVQGADRTGWRARDRRLFEVVARVVTGSLERQRQAAELAARHAELRYTLDHTPLILWRTDAQGIFQSGQGQGLLKLGMNEQALMGLSALEVYGAFPEVVQSVRRGLAGEAHRGLSSVAGRHYETHYQPLLGDDGQQTGLMGLSYDVTERVDAERRTGALLRISQLLDDTAGVPQVAEQVLQALAEALPVDWLTLWQRDGEVLRPLAVHGEAIPEVVQMQQYGAPLSWVEPFGVLDGEPAAAQADRLPRTLTAAGIRSGLVLPVWLDDPQRAVFLGAFCRHDQPCSPDQQRILDVAAQTIRAAVAREHRTQTLQTLAHTDSLTGLGNRRAMEARLMAVLKDLPLTGQTLTVLSVDVDGFKAVNDRRGHAAGDELLITLSRALSTTLRATDWSYRIGGDEFLVLLTTPAGSGLPPLDRRLSQVEAAVQSAGFPEVGLSWGQATTAADGVFAGALLRCSDERLYLHKRGKQVAG